MEEARPRQPGDMIRVIQARIDVSTEITNRGGFIGTPSMMSGSNVHLARRRVEPSQKNSVFDACNLS